MLHILTYFIDQPFSFWCHTLRALSPPGDPPFQTGGESADRTRRMSLFGKGQNMTTFPGGINSSCGSAGLHIRYLRRMDGDKVVDLVVNSLCLVKHSTVDVAVEILACFVAPFASTDQSSSSQTPRVYLRCFFFVRYNSFPMWLVATETQLAKAQSVGLKWRITARLLREEMSFCSKSSLFVRCFSEKVLKVEFCIHLNYCKMSVFWGDFRVLIETRTKRNKQFLELIAAFFFHRMKYLNFKIKALGVTIDQLSAVRYLNTSHWSLNRAKFVFTNAFTGWIGHFISLVKCGKPLCNWLLEYVVVCLELFWRVRKDT